MPYKDHEQKRLNGIAYREQNREVITAKRAASYAVNPEPAKQRSKAWKLAHPESRAGVQAWQKAHPERMRELRSRYETPERHLARLHKRRYSTVFVEAVSREEVWARDEGICGICHEDADPANWHLDHIKPVSKGGLHCYANVQVSHPLCNLQKADRFDTKNKEAD